MQLHNVQAKTKRKKSKLIGRGGTRGKTSGRGHKGQKAHGGHGIRPATRDIIKKIPKKRGYRFNSIQEKPFVINVSTLEAVFKAGETVDPNVLLERGLVSKRMATKPIKILGKGDLTKKLTLAGMVYSKSALEKITAVGGSAT